MKLPWIVRDWLSNWGWQKQMKTVITPTHLFPGSNYKTGVLLAAIRKQKYMCYSSSQRNSRWSQNSGIINSWWKRPSAENVDSSHIRKAQWHQLTTHRPIACFKQEHEPLQTRSIQTCAENKMWQKLIGLSPLFFKCMNLSKLCTKIHNTRHLWWLHTLISRHPFMSTGIQAFVYKHTIRNMLFFSLFITLFCV